MAYLTYWVIFLSVITSIYGQPRYSPNEYDGFDCRRYPNSCSFGGPCSPVTGNCSCNGLRVGRDCSLPSTGRFVDRCNTIQCSRDGGLCYIIENFNIVEERCYCRSEWTGFDCSLRRATMACTETGMVIHVYPQTNLAGLFNGFLAIQDPDTGILLSGIRECFSDVQATNGIIEWDGLRFQKAISLLDTGPCVSARRVVTGENGLETCFQVRLLYSPFIIAGIDELYNFCCEEAGSIDGVINVENGGGTPVAVNVTTLIQPLIREVRWKLDNRVISQGERIQVGDLIRFAFRIDTSVTTKRDFRLDNCYARPGALSGGFPLITDRCRAPEALGVVQGIEREFGVNGVEVIIDVSAFQLRDSPEVNVTCEFTLCPLSCGGVSVCANTNILNHGRRKRNVNVTGESQDDEKGEVSMLFVIGGKDCDKPEAAPSSEPECYLGVFLPVVVVLAVLVLVLLVTTLVLCKRQMKVHKNSNTAVTPKSP